LIMPQLDFWMMITPPCPDVRLRLG